MLEYLHNANCSNVKKNRILSHEQNEAIKELSYSIPNTLFMKTLADLCINKIKLRSI